MFLHRTSQAINPSVAAILVCGRRWETCVQWRAKLVSVCKQIRQPFDLRFHDLDNSNDFQNSSISWISLGLIDRRFLMTGINFVNHSDIRTCEKLSATVNNTQQINVKQLKNRRASWIDWFTSNNLNFYHHFCGTFHEYQIMCLINIFVSSLVAHRYARFDPLKF